MSAKRKFIYNGIVLTLVGFAMRGVALFLGAYISSEIGAEGIGLQGLIATVYSFAVTFATSGVSLSVTRLVASSIGEGRGGGRVMRGAFLYALCFGAVATAILFIFADLIGAVILSDVRIAVALRILSLSLLPIALFGFIKANQARSHSIEHTFPYFKAHTPLVNDQKCEAMVFYIKIVKRIVFYTFCRQGFANVALFIIVCPSYHVNLL